MERRCETGTTGSIGSLLCFRSRPVSSQVVQLKLHLPPMPETIRKIESDGNVSTDSALALLGLWPITVSGPVPDEPCTFRKRQLMAGCGKWLSEL